MQDLLNELEIAVISRGNVTLSIGSAVFTWVEEPVIHIHQKNSRRVYGEKVNINDGSLGS